MKPQPTAGYAIRPLTGFGRIACPWCDARDVKKCNPGQKTCGAEWCKRGQNNYRTLLRMQGVEVAEAYKVKRIAERVKL